MSHELDPVLPAGNRKVLFVGIGNVLKRDDGVGVYITDRIINRANISALTVEVSIENYIGKINSLEPDILVLVDCVEMNAPPGTYRLLKPSEIKDLTFNTHNISLNRIADFFKMPVFILGIQPGIVEFGENISYIVRKVAERIIKKINVNEASHG